jgi:hypothetical protein
MQYFIMRLNVGLCEMWSPMLVYVKLNVATWIMLNVSPCVMKMNASLCVQKSNLKLYLHVNLFL